MLYLNGGETGDELKDALHHGDVGQGEQLLPAHTHLSYTVKIIQCYSLNQDPDPELRRPLNKDLSYFLTLYENKII